MRKSAQAISEYIVLLTLIAAALATMQFYFRRGIQAAVKIAADQVGAQRQGAADFDYNLEWKQKRDDTTTFTTSFSTDTEVKLPGAAVIYGKNETTIQEGAASYGAWRLRD